LVAEVELLEEGDPGDDWGSAVEALARYLHAHAELRSFLDQQRRSTEPMSWVNLACQHLPITATARQRLLESAAPERCLKLSRDRSLAERWLGGLLGFQLVLSIVTVALCLAIGGARYHGVTWFAVVILSVDLVLKSLKSTLRWVLKALERFGTEAVSLLFER